MNLNYLRYFAETCRQGSITKASEAVHVSQPSVTAAIKELENEFCMPLFFRTNSRIFPTPEGKQLWALAETLLKQVDSFYSAAKELGENPDVTLKLGLPSVLGTFFFDKIVPGFQLENPHIRLEIIEAPTVTGVHMLEESALDFIIGIEEEKTKNLCASEPLFETSLVFAASVHNPLTEEPVITKQMLRNEPFVIISKGSYHYDAILSRFASDPLNVVLQSSQVSTIRYMVENNYASTIIYPEIFRSEPAIRCVPLEEPIGARVKIFWWRNSYVTAAMKTFIRYLKRVSQV